MICDFNAFVDKLCWTNRTYKSFKHFFSSFLSYVRCRIVYQMFNTSKNDCHFKKKLLADMVVHMRHLLHIFFIFLWVYSFITWCGNETCRYWCTFSPASNRLDLYCSVGIGSKGKERDNEERIFTTAQFHVVLTESNIQFELYFSLPTLLKLTN